ncbi:MAG TPA: YggS family pyridoxal phosphate-dependent enzyme [Bacillota bacterium]|nr:YggS family pyridoxal phosphate-dependent enzyme [Bacillota bacterium]HPL54757.1 YggS family pyridoxal phosphate-dependent enzyme [Bacillota bacterium]
MQEIRDNIMSILGNIKDVCMRTGRDPDSVTLIAVTKTIDPDRINYALECGIRNIGENKVQELTAKYASVEKNVKWHLIGHLQTNKVKYIIDKVGLVHSVDSINLAREIDKRAENAGLVKDILVQVNVAQEETKYGIEYEEIDSFVEQLSMLRNISVKGLMTIAPYYEDMEMVRPVFRMLKEKYDMLAGANIPNVEMRHLSMGMTNDYEAAIEEGSNMIRIGTGIFGARSYNI